MMPNLSSDALFQLIRSLDRSEKRAFKLFVRRSSGTEDLKMLQLFDAIDGLKEHSDAALMKKLGMGKKEQLANRKMHLYRQVLACLRTLESNTHMELHLHEQLDFARILYDRGLYLQSLRVLDRAKETARVHGQDSFCLQALFLEKKIEGLHITRSFKDRAQSLAQESAGLMESLDITSQLSSLALELYGWYINNGHVRSAADEAEVMAFFKSYMPAGAEKLRHFYQRLYYHQCCCWYAFIRLDFRMYYRHTQQWVDLFTAQPQMLAVETSHYIKGIHNLLSAHFDLGNAKKFSQTLAQFDSFCASDLVKKHESNAVQAFVYGYTAKLNLHFMQGRFTEGLLLIPEIEQGLNDYAHLLDTHRVLVFYYKMASLYFGSGDHDNTIVHLSKIIHWKTDLRSDLQCYARLLHLIAHYELGNFKLLEYLVKSVYRFMAKMDNLGVVEDRILRFLHKSFRLTQRQLLPEFEALLQELRSLEENKFASRAFAYLDIISWLESKLQRRSIQEVIREKYVRHSGRRQE